MDERLTLPRPRSSGLAAAEARVAELEARLAAAERLLAVSNEVLIRHGERDRDSYISPALQAVLGLDPVTTSMEDIRALVHPDDRPSRVAARLYADAGIASTSVVRMRHADGRYRTLETSMTPIVRDGVVTELVGSLRDVTATTTVKAAHAELESALDALNRSVTLVTIVRREGAEPELVVRFANHYVRSRLGLSVEQVAGRPFAQIFPAVSAAGYEARYLEVATTGETLTLIVENFTGQVVQGSFEVTVVPWGEDGLVIDVADVTDQRTAQMALERSEQRLAEAQRLAGLGSWDWDLVTDTLVWSAVEHQLLGVPLSVTPTPELVHAMIPVEDRAGVMAVCRAARASGGSFTTRHRMRRPDGRIVHLAGWGHVELGPDGTATRMWGTERDVTAEVQREADLTEQALTDPLTGLLNRRGWDGATALGAHGQVVVGQVAVAVLDLDHFKRFNDTHGHAAGDALLRACAAAWTARLRPGDVLARTGGEEFAVLLPGCDLAAAVTVLDDLRRSMPATATASAGVTLLGSRTVEDALSCADVALYRAKRTGRNRTVAA